MLTVEQLALAVALVFGGGVLMLLLGTQILNWYWLALLGGAGAVVAWFRLRGRRLPPYRVAQIVDRRLHLSDSLSTAWFLLATPRQDDAIARVQIQQAEQAARTVDPGRAFPFTGQRAWALTAALGVVVFGLFSLRYLITRSLSLERALVPIHLGTAFERIENALSANNRLPNRAAPGEQPIKNQAAGGQQEDGRSDVLQDQGAKTGQQQDGTGARQPQTQNPNSPSQAKPQDGQSQTPQADASNAQQNAKDQGERAAGSDQATSERPNDKQEQSENGQQASSGLVNKMKDALSSLLAKMHPNPGSQKSPQNGDRSPQSQQGSDQNSSAQNQKGQQQDARNNQQSNQQQSSEAQAQGQTTERAQASQGRNTDQSPQQGSDAHSGIGRQDGDKELKEAEQLRAMGKLAEIIGKRSASLTGEMMVETPSGKQQLKTEYSQRLGHHADLGGEINRDEIPLADQQYIREYMELVRKQGKNP